MNEMHAATGSEVFFCTFLPAFVAIVDANSTRKYQHQDENKVIAEGERCISSHFCS